MPSRKKKRLKYQWEQGRGRGGETFWRKVAVAGSVIDPSTSRKSLLIYIHIFKSHIQYSLS